MILPLSQSKVKTDPLQAKAQAFAGLSILSPSLLTSFPRVPNPVRIAATTEQANPHGVYVSVKNNLIDCALRHVRSAVLYFLRRRCIKANICKVGTGEGLPCQPSFKSRSVSRCVPLGEVFTYPCRALCVPLDWQEFRQVSQASF